MDLHTLAAALVLPKGWYLCDEEEQRSRQAELSREVTPGHALHGRTCHAIAQDSASDDVLFACESPGPLLALVHLTWRNDGAETPPWPWTTLFASADAWNLHPGREV